MNVDRLIRRCVQVGASAFLVSLALGFGATSADASAGTVVKDRQYGFSFTVPANWKQVPLNGSDVTALLNAATHDDPTLTNALSSEVSSAAAKGMKVFAIGPVTGTTAPDVNVIVSSSAGAPSGNGFAAAAIAEAKIELTQAGASHITTSIVKSRLGRSAEATYQLELKAGTPAVVGEQIYAVHGSHVVIVTVTTSSLTASKSDTRLISNTWRW